MRNDLSGEKSSSPLRVHCVRVCLVIQRWIIDKQQRSWVLGGLIIQPLPAEKRKWMFCTNTSIRQTIQPINDISIIDGIRLWKWCSGLVLPSRLHFLPLCPSFLIRGGQFIEAYGVEWQKCFLKYLKLLERGMSVLGVWKALAPSSYLQA